MSVRMRLALMTLLAVCGFVNLQAYAEFHWTPFLLVGILVCAFTAIWAVVCIVDYAGRHGNG